MENPVVIRKVSHGEKGYVGEYRGPGYPYSVYYTNKPFSDPNVQKFELEDALKVVQTTQISSPFEVIQIIDATGKALYDNHNKRFVYKDNKHMRNVANDLKNIIKEEIQRSYNSGTVVVGGENFNFIQPVNSAKVGFYNYASFSSEYDTDISESNIAVTWQVVFWVNGYGIENFAVHGEKVEGQYKLQFLDRQSDEVVQETVKNIAEVDWKFETEDNVVLALNKSLYVMGLDFDFNTQTCRIYF
ncbi:MAG: hypothetical protein WC333_01545 [Dehalococcoidia bacterium]|jgi:hypothetical protein